MPVTHTIAIGSTTAAADSAIIELDDNRNVWLWVYPEITSASDTIEVWRTNGAGADVHMFKDDEQGQHHSEPVALDHDHQAVRLVGPAKFIIKKPVTHQELAVVYDS